MASYAYTFTSGDTVTPTKLNNARTVSEIVNADIKSDAAIAGSKLADSAITTVKIADANVTAAKIADANVTAAKLASNSVETAKIADDAVTDAKLSLAANAGEVKKALNADNSPPIFACRAWVNFDGTAGSTVDGEFRCTIRASGNVSKVVRSATGDYTVTFSTAMPDTNACVQMSFQTNGVANGLSADVFGVSTSASSHRVRTLDSSGFGVNSPFICVSFFR